SRLRGVRRPEADLGNRLSAAALGAAHGQGARIRRARARLLHARGPGTDPGPERPGHLAVPCLSRQPFEGPPLEKRWDPAALGYAPPSDIPSSSHSPSLPCPVECCRKDRPCPFSPDCEQTPCGRRMKKRSNWPRSTTSSTAG